MSYFNLFVFFYFGSFSFYTNASYRTPIIKVKIASTLKNIYISGRDINRINHINHKSKKYSGPLRINFNCNLSSKKTMQQLIKNKPLLLASLNSGTGLISISNKTFSKVKRYRGKLHLITSPKGDSCDIVNEIPIDSYIASLLSKEMNSKWPIEALKAQAIAARTYAIHKKNKKIVSRNLGSKAFYDLESSEKHQVSGEFFDITKKTLKATKETKGEVLFSKEGKLTPIFFHANCGGRTLLPNSVWKNKVSGYTKSVKCPSCLKSSKRNWNKTISLNRFMKFLKWADDQSYINVKKIAYSKLEFRFMSDNIVNTQFRLYLDERLIVIKKPLLRRYFGRYLFPSNNFTMKYKKNINEFRVKGRGLGHGVGMCQVGALAFAKNGWSYQQILSHYFPGHELKKIY